MKSRNLAYWISTILASSVMTVSGLLAITHAPAMMKGLAHLGYPVYFSDLLGVAKLSGVIVLLSPGLGRFKEWAYAEFVITVLSASYSHLSSGDGVMALEPLATLIALVISYATRPANRRFFPSLLESSDAEIARARVAPTARP